MSKVLWLIVIAIAVVVLVPPVREKVRPHMQFVFDPIYEQSAKTRVNEIRSVVKRADAAGRPIPTGRQFAEFVEHEDMQQNASTDPWGSAYYITGSGRGFQVGSAGKDRQPGTGDDILSTPETLTHPLGRRQRR